jgi:hypothetical protein
MIVKEPTDLDLAWLPQYILGGFDVTGFTPSMPAIHTMIDRCRKNGYALIAEHKGQPAGILGAVINPSFWAQESEINVVALRSTYPGAGAALVRELLARSRATFAAHVVVTLENPDPRLDRAMRRFGQYRLLRSYVFQN